MHFRFVLCVLSVSPGRDASVVLVIHACIQTACIRALNLHDCPAGLPIFRRHTAPQYTTVRRDGLYSGTKSAPQNTTVRRDSMYDVFRRYTAPQYTIVLRDSLYSGVRYCTALQACPPGQPIFRRQILHRITRLSGRTMRPVMAPRGL